MRKLALLVLVFAMLVPASITGAASTKYTAKVYPAVQLAMNPKKLPVKLPNGLTIDKEPGDSLFPVIKYAGKKVWTGKNDFEGSGDIQFTLTSGGDTFLYTIYYIGASGGLGVDLVGVHANGKVFVKKNFGGIDLTAKFLKADSFEVAVEKLNPKWNPAKDSNAERHSGIYDVTVYQLTSKGIVKQKSYVRKK